VLQRYWQKTARLGLCGARHRPWALWLRGAGSAGVAAGEGFESFAGDERVEHAEEVVAVVLVEFGEGGEAFAEAVVLGVESSSGHVVDGEVVDRDVERLGDVGDRARLGVIRPFGVPPLFWTS
jgi:hypothetical protein